MSGKKSFKMFFRLGYNKSISGSHDLRDSMQEAFRKFEYMRVVVGRLSEDCFQIEITTENVPTVRDSVDIKEEVQGLIGDTIYLSLGEKIKILKYWPTKGLEIEFIPE